MGLEQHAHIGLVELEQLEHIALVELEQRGHIGLVELERHATQTQINSNIKILVSA